MKRALSLFLIAWLALTGTVAVLASGPGVQSEPHLFSVIKTDRSGNANVHVSGDRMWFTPGYGAGGRMYGFQPASSYHYRDLVRLQNDSSAAITVWYTLEGDLADLYSAGIFSLGLAGLTESWEQSAGRPIAAGESLAPVDFHFHIPSGQRMTGYDGAIRWFAAAGQTEIIPPEPPGTEPEPWADQFDGGRLLPELPRTGGLIARGALPGLLLLLAAGLLLYRKR